MNWNSTSGSSTVGMYNTASIGYSMSTATTTAYTMTDSQPKPETDGPDDDGSAGVREPRRPRPVAPAGAMAIDYEEVST